VRDRKTGVVGVLPESAAMKKERVGLVALAPGHRATARPGPGGRLVRADGTEPPSRFHEIVESGKAPAGFVH
jgi:hypothetical protein